MKYFCYSGYVRHSPIGESRILDYDGHSILIKYEWDNKLYTQWISVVDFIRALISNIPRKNFKVVRYYGMYASTLYESSLLAIGQLNKSTARCFPGNPVQISLYEMPLNGPPRCDRCGAPMNLVMIVFWSGIRKVVKIL